MLKVDPCDAWMLNAYSWCRFPGKGKDYYHAVVNGKHTLIHRLILGAKDGEIVDHINGDTSDNRRSNLRICTITQNARNRCVNRNSTTGVKGVSPAPNGKYRARIRTDDGRIHLGCFNTVDEAHAAYRAASMKHHGEFGRS